MATGEVQSERVQPLNEEGVREDGDYVLYWMQASVRSRFNHALEYAVQRANDLGRRLLVVFGLTDSYPEANLRHYTFLVEGLKDVEGNLKERGIKFVVRRGSPDDVALGEAERASLVVTDRGYLRHQREWRERVAREAGREVVQVESDVVVPVELASDKKETAARTLRPKIKRHLEDFLVELEPTELEKDSTGLSVKDGLDLSDVGKVTDGMDLDRSVGALSHLYRGGESEARRVLSDFLRNRFDSYTDNRNQPQTDSVSHMSKYLHYGHISPVEVALKVRGSSAPEKEKETYLEELIVRRELPMNFVFYEKNYDSFSCLPGWAKETLKKHKSDAREYAYTRAQLEEAETHDEYWNAAMREMKHTGYMHNYMRMYWGKKILEWSNTPEYAYSTVLYLNNKYFLDGRDPNSYANVAWVFGQHDQGWKERAVFGKVRYMSSGGLERKAKPEEYVEKVDRLVEGR
ncbi:FAD binding domain of DNA photolyase [Rubrobacter radiotolerans]|uniref:Deoxyribodipyrimidine photo-lyase n=1 Tax=Rubrobacter radiotolerans TaxID=42256 RepID=A0A023X5Z6_RUBRA|nr:deoxyribodipyrimidine photo-lyase [Rubrobacter radiotolerans]AHY47479.1 FAD binding domain of DNA photolyase [Rubrobacter radiotolerans]MDX5894883.1 deoxyribodipyrimidine photo-lyase [Rubrobacter radiotolerans]SMC06991.1 Deoxyribodipyrimidine photo-lyase type II [Rubrobacter radiotolerans DSM 5868]